MAGKKRKYNEEDYPVFANNGNTQKNYTYWPALTMHRFQIVDNLPFNTGITYPYIIATADEPCELSNLIFDIDVNYDANEYHPGGMFDGNPTPRLNWAIVNTSANNTGILSVPTHSGNFYIPEQRLWRGGMLHLSPVFPERKGTRENPYTTVATPDNLPIINYTTAGEITGVPATMDGTIKFPKFTTFHPARDIYTVNDNTTILIKSAKIKGYSTEVKKFQVGDQLLLLINANFNNTNFQVQFSGSIFFNQYL